MLFLKRKHLPLKTVYYISFLCFMVMIVVIYVIQNKLIHGLILRDRR